MTVLLPDTNETASNAKHLLLTTSSSLKHECVIGMFTTNKILYEATYHKT